jgi:nitronate monooxygenase
MVTQSNSDDIVYSNFYTGVHGNYLRGSIKNAGMDPDALPNGDPTQMNFASGEGERSAKAWKDIWGCGQGIGVIRDVVPVAELVGRWRGEYQAAKARLCQP